MPVKETILNPEQKAAEQAVQAASEKEFASRLAQSMDLPSTLTGEIADAEKKASQEPEIEEVEDVSEVEAGESSSRESEEGAEEAEEGEELEAGDEPKESESKESEAGNLSDSEEDLIPKSKVQKRFDEMTAHIKRIEAELKKEREARESAVPKSDPQLEALEKMGQDELKTMKRQVRVEQIKAANDEARLAQLLDLEEKIDSTLQTAPQRFHRAQFSNLQSAIESSRSSVENFDAVSKQIDDLALSIYKESPELQGSVYGKARAWDYAVKHIQAVQKASEGKSDQAELKRQVNTLKKKISVDTTTKKGVQLPDSDTRLKRKAIHGSESDKIAFIKTRVNVNDLVPDSELRTLENLRR